MFVYTGSTLTYEAHYAHGPLGRRIEARYIDLKNNGMRVERYIYNGFKNVIKLRLDGGLYILEKIYFYGSLTNDDILGFMKCVSNLCTQSEIKFYGKLMNDFVE